MTQESPSRTQGAISNAQLREWSQSDSRRSDLVRRLSRELLAARESIELLSEDQKRCEHKPPLVLVTVERCGVIVAHVRNAAVRCAVEPIHGGLAGEVERKHGRFWAGMLNEREQLLGIIPAWTGDTLREIKCIALDRAEREKDHERKGRWLRLFLDADFSEIEETLAMRLLP